MEFPKVVKVRRKFPRPRVEDVEETVREQLAREEIAGTIRPGMSVALTAGSRGIAEIDGILRSLVEGLKELGAEPFIVPAMGSHGGATAEGQVEILESLGVTEESCGAPIRSSMEVVELGETDRGVPVYMDRIASEADGVVVVNRIKAHTDFRSDIESGLLKMASIGLGKHHQALALHGYGVEGIRDFMVEVGEKVLESWHVLFGLATVENAYDEPAIIEAILPADIPQRERELLAEYMEMMPDLPVADIDVLHVDALGKNYSGTGMDTNVIGRFRILGVEEPERPNVKYLIVGDISEESHGNALGIGLADLTTTRLAERIDQKAMNENVLTSTFIERAKIPMVMANDRKALEAAIRCNWGVPPEETRFVRIPNTLHLEYMYVSENLLEEALGHDDLEVVGEAADLAFDDNDNLTPFDAVEGEGHAVAASSAAEDGYYPGDL
ncbi:MAG TPA: lactate racemase domain-containing protein [Rubrobacteraceae bacterium]|nr:lactate racemase domain-containing protein [Rubrobacteraceae bacterium]